MANNFTDYLETAIINHFLKAGAAVTQPTSHTLGLFTSDPAEASTGGTEVSGGAYARQAITFTTPTANGTAMRTSNAAQISFPAASASWGTITHYVIFDNSGNRLIAGPLAASKTIGNGDIFQVPAGNFTLDID